jgi:ribosomal protein S18 acetylase RimI-like enzyme
VGQIVITKLVAEDKVSKFSVLDESDSALRIFIRKHAEKSSQANLTQTYVAKVEDSSQVLGYLSIMCAEISLQQNYTIDDKAAANRFLFQPAIRIAKLAVDAKHQRIGIGKALLQFAIGLISTSVQPAVGCRFVVLDAKSKSVPFYKRLGFRLLDTIENREQDAPVMFLDLQNLT